MSFNIAIIGPGRIADTALAPAVKLARGAQLWSVLSRDYERAEQFALHHGAAARQPAHTELGSLLADPDLHGVIIASPDKLHAEQAIACARAGKHVFCEKPLATDVESAQQIVTACADADVRLGVAYHLRWHAGHRMVERKIREGFIGAPRHMRMQWTFFANDDSNWRASPDVGKWWGLAGVGTHCLDMVRWYMTPDCGEITSLESVIDRSVWRGPHDETAVLAIGFENGGTAEICTSVLFHAPPRAEVYGSTGFVRFEGTLGPQGAGSIDSHQGALEFVPVNPYLGEIEDFLTAIRDHRDPEVTGVEAVRNVELLVQAGG